MRCLMIGGDVRGRPGMSRGRHDVPGGRSKECGVGPDRGPRLGADASNRPLALVPTHCPPSLSPINTSTTRYYLRILNSNLDPV